MGKIFFPETDESGNSFVGKSSLLCIVYLKKMENNRPELLKKLSSKIVAGFNIRAFNLFVFVTWKNKNLIVT